MSDKGQATWDAEKDLGEALDVIEDLEAKVERLREERGHLRVALDAIWETATGDHDARPSAMRCERIRKLATDALNNDTDQ